MDQRHVANVQILRFLAALCVTLAHVGSAVGERTSSFQMVYPLDWGIGVDIFFIISGFIMYYTMHERFGGMTEAVSFLRRRIVRVVPLYWLCTTMMLLSIFFAGDFVNNGTLDVAHLVSSYLFVPWPRSDGGLFPVLSLGWTLNYEMYFYALFGIALIFSARTGMVALFVLISIPVVLSVFFSENWWVLKFWGDTIVVEFLIGIALASIILRGYRVSLNISLILILLGIVCAIVFYQMNLYEIIFRILTGGVPAAMIAAGFIMGPKVPLRRPYTWLIAGGDASYALYLTHPFTSKIVAIGGAQAGLSPILTFWSAALASIAVAVFVHNLFEKPTGALLSSWFSYRKA